MIGYFGVFLKLKLSLDVHFCHVFNVDKLLSELLNRLIAIPLVSQLVLLGLSLINLFIQSFDVGSTSAIIRQVFFFMFSYQLCVLRSSAASF